MGPRRSRSGPALPLVLAVLLLLVTACVPTGPAPTIVAFLLPEAPTARYEQLDKPFFEQRLAVAGDYRVIYANASDSAVRQQEQAESALAAGASVLVVDPVDSTAARTIVDAAAALGVPVVAYDRFIAGGAAAFYVSFDSVRVGELQAEALVEGLAARGTPRGGVLVLGGSPTDVNSGDLLSGALPVLEAAGVPVLASYDVPGWSPQRAQEWMATQLAQFGDRVDGVYAANDGLAGAALAAMRTAGIESTPVVVGQDADLSAIRRLVAGTQHATVFKNIAMQARIAADAAKALAAGETPSSWDVVDGVPSVVLDPVLVTADDIDRIIVSTGLYTIEDICLPDLVEACLRAGIPADRVAPKVGG